MAEILLLTQQKVNLHNFILKIYEQRMNLEFKIEKCNIIIYELGSIEWSWKFRILVGFPTR